MTRTKGGSRTAMIWIALGTSVLLLTTLRIYAIYHVHRAQRRYPPLGNLVTVDGISLHYVERGAGQPILLIHGDGGSVYDWDMSILDRVAREHRVVSFDRPGFGYSERPKKGASPFVQARLLHKATERLGIDKPILVGHSRGGNVALAYSLAYPDDVAGVVTLAAAPYGGQIALHNQLLTVPILGPLLAHTLYVPLGGPAVRAGLEVAFAPEGPPPSDYLAAYAAYELRPHQLLAHAADQVHGRAGTERMIPRYGEIRPPLVVVHGTTDRNVPIAQARRLAGTVPSAQLLEVPGAGHELMFWHPDVVLEAIGAVGAARSTSP